MAACLNLTDHYDKCSSPRHNTCCGGGGLIGLGSLLTDEVNDRVLVIIT